MQSRYEFYRNAFRNIGAASLLRRQLQRKFGGEVIKLSSKQLKYPIYARKGSSDMLVFDQIFVEDEYRPLLRLKDPRLILDCGANVGYSSAYFLSAFPETYVIAVEPDPDNFALLVNNLAPYAGRYRAIQAAVWPYTEKLRFSKSFSGRGMEWGRTVERAVNSDAAIDTVSIPTLLAGHDRISLLKVDIEGAERELFSVAHDLWIGKVDNIAIELHGREAEKIFFDAIPKDRFRLSRSGELTICMGTFSDHA